uniref:Uncharacterized protein n=1 Tax=Arundo donax TaxID=35708 RepID=A0A0A9GF27_ARUDO
MHCVHPATQRQGPQAQSFVHLQRLHDGQAPLQDTDDEEEATAVRARGGRGQQEDRMGEQRRARGEQPVKIPADAGHHA